MHGEEKKMRSHSLQETDRAAPADAARFAAPLAALDWRRFGASLDETGYALIPNLLSAAECAALARHYEDDRHFRSRVVMARHGFGRGEYKYFTYPLPEVVQHLRAALYPPLAE